MIYIENKKYYRICDECGDLREIKKQAYLNNSKKEKHFCLSCAQRGERNHQYGKASWNKGLTKEQDDRVRKYGEKGSLAKMGSVPWNIGHSYEELKGCLWAKEFKDNVSSAKKGVPNYKRRYSTAHNKSFKYFRTACKNLLYISWTRPILERDKFKCTQCGTHEELEVHHIKPFRKILQTVADELEFDLNEYVRSEINKKREYEEAFAEVDEILKIMPIDLLSKIPAKFRQVISENK